MGTSSETSKKKISMPNSTLWLTKGAHTAREESIFQTLQDRNIHHMRSLKKTVLSARRRNQILIITRQDVKIYLQHTMNQDTIISSSVCILS